MAYDGPFTGDEVDAAIRLAYGPFVQFSIQNEDVTITNPNEWVEIDVLATVTFLKDFALFPPGTPGISYIGDHPVIVKMQGPFSMSSSTNNVKLDVAVGLNGTPDEKSLVSRFIGTGGDIGAASLGYLLSIVKTDKLSVHIRCDKATVMTIVSAPIMIMPAIAIAPAV